MPGLGALWDSLVDCICRPPRDDYLYPDDLIGGRRGHFRVGRYQGVREDLTLVNRRGMRLACSHFFPKHVRGRDGRMPCVLYCHCNSGSRRDAEEAICVLIPCGVSVFTLDFAGSGLSEGQWVTLGAEEVEDVGAAVEYLRASGRVSTLGLWGRSMGAVTALLYSQRDPSIAGMVLDSPFSRLTDLMMEIVAEQRLPVPRPLAKLALAAMRRSVSKRAGFDITKVAPVDAVSQSFIPALFGHATGDTFIRISHAEALHGAYAGDKNLIRFEGDHNSRRPEFFYNSVSIFWHNTLQLEQLLEPAPPSQGVGPPGLLAPAGGAPGRPGGVGIPLAPPVPPPPRPLASPEAGRPGSPAAPDLLLSSDGDIPAAAANGGGAGDASVGGGGGEDVAEAGTARRSAPWEPRLWEWELDRAERERQRFRRMAGGLPGPADNAHRGTSSSAAGGGGGAFDLTSLLTAAGEPSGASLEGIGNGGGGPGGHELLPGSEEEEEAQLMAALQLSLLEAAMSAAAPPSSEAATATAGSCGGGGAAAAASGRSSAQRRASGRSTGGGAGAAGPLSPPSSLSTRPLQHMPTGPLPSAAAGAASTAAKRSLSQGEALAPARPPPLPLVALSGAHQDVPPSASQQYRPQPQSQQQQQQGPCSGRDGPACAWPLPSLIPPPASAGAAKQQPAAASAATPSTASRAAPLAASSAAQPPAPAPAAAATAASSTAGGGGGGSARTRRSAATGPSLYDMYSDDELLEMAVRLSLAEAGPTRGSPADANGGSGKGT